MLANSIPNAEAASDCKIKKFIKVDNYFYRGAQPSDKDIKCLADMGIKTVINLRLLNPIKDAKQKKIAAKFGIEYINMPLNPFISPSKEQLDHYFRVLDDPNRLPVFVHCWHGEDRTGVMSALYRIKYYNWSFDDAFAEMKADGYHSMLFPQPVRFLRNYAASGDTHKSLVKYHK